MMGFRDAIRDANRAIEPEQSVAVRISVMMTVLVAVVALLTEELVGGFAATAAITLIPAGFWLSYRMRNSDALGLKAILAVALLTSVAFFLGDLFAAASAGFVNVQAPLAELFLWVQIVHSAHVPARRDLMFSLVSSGVMFAITAALSISLIIAPFLMTWLVGFVVSLLLAHKSSMRELSPLQTNDSPSEITAGVTKSAALALSAVLIVGALVFAVMPAATVTRAFTFPIALPTSSPVANPGGLSNPALGANGAADALSGSDGFSSRSSFGYFGFSEFLDTGNRGRPDDTLVMRVRAPAPAFWRGQTFDTWDGRTWTLSDQSTQTITGRPIQTRRTPGDDGPATTEFIQTFYMETAGPNVIFGAYRMSDIFFEGSGLFQLPEGTVRAGVDLPADTIYTVISQRPFSNEENLREADPLLLGIPDGIAATYLQVPASTPQRVIDLATEITRTELTTYDKVRAIETWMATNTTYTLDIPPLPEGEDALDHYLFQTQQGFCEQIGSSLAIMLRSQGIPARLVVGYTPGIRNPFTGLYEVKASDAHSWTEVYFPGIGWQGFDPTAQVPLADDAYVDSASEGMGAFLAARLGNIAQVGTALISIVIVGVFGFAFSALATQFLRRRRELQNRSWSEIMFERINQAGSLRGEPRHPHQTWREYAQVLVDTEKADRQLLDVVELISWDALSGSSLSESDRLKAEEKLRSVLDRKTGVRPG